MRRLGANRHAGGDPGHRGGRRGSSAARWNPRRRLGADGVCRRLANRRGDRGRERRWRASRRPIPVRGLSGGVHGARPARTGRHGVDARHPVLRGGHRDPAGAHASAAGRYRGGGARRGHRRQGGGRPRLRAAAGGAADPGRLGGRLRPPRNHRRPGADRRAGRTPPHPGVRHLAAARPRDRDGARRRGAARPRPELRAHLDHAQRPHRRGRWPGGRRPRDPAAAGTDRGEIRARRADAASPQADRGHRGAAGADRRHAVTGLDPRQRRQAEFRQCRLRACGRGQERRRCGRTRHRAVRWRGARRNPARPRGGGRLRGPAAGGHRRPSPHPRRDLGAGRARLGRHRHRRHRSRGAARRPGADDRRPPPHARPARHRGGDLRLGPQARVLQRRLSFAVGPRRRVPRPGPDQLVGARPVALRAPAARRAGLPPVEGGAARGLPRARSQGTSLVPAGRAHHAGRHHAQSGRRRDLPVRRRHRAARSRAPLRLR